jgi:hypothetical protein
MVLRTLRQEREGNSGQNGDSVIPFVEPGALDLPNGGRLRRGGLVLFVETDDGHGRPSGPQNDDSAKDHLFLVTPG